MTIPPSGYQLSPPIFLPHSFRLHIPPTRCPFCHNPTFSYWLPDQGRFSSPTPWKYYSNHRQYPRAKCNGCNRRVPKLITTTPNLESHTST